MSKNKGSLCLVMPRLGPNGRCLTEKANRKEKEIRQSQRYMVLNGRELRVGGLITDSAA